MRIVEKLTQKQIDRVDDESIRTALNALKAYMEVLSGKSPNPFHCQENLLGIGNGIKKAPINGERGGGIVKAEMDDMDFMDFMDRAAAWITPKLLMVLAGIAVGYFWAFRVYG